MPNLLERIGDKLIGIFDGSQKQERDAPAVPSLFTAGYGIPPPVKSREGLKVYQSNPWVYAVTNAIVYEAMQTKICLRRVRYGKDGEEYEQIFEHQALELINNPIPQATGRSHVSGTLHTALTWIHLINGGESFWVVTERFAGIPSEMHLLMPDKVNIHLDGQRLPVRYEFIMEGRSENYSADDVIHFKLPDPLNLYRGQSALLASAGAIDTDTESSNYIWNYFKNRALPEAVLTRQTEPKPDEVDRIKSMWRSLYQGSQNAGKLGFLWGGAEIKELGRNQREMQFKELKEFNRDTIMASLRTGKGIVGLMEDQSRANAEAQDYVFAKRVVRPYLMMYVQQLTSDYLPLFGATEDRNGRLEFYFKDNVPEDELTKSTVMNTLFQMGAVSINEVRSKFGMDAREEPEADALWGSISKIPLGEEFEDSALAEPTDDGEDEDIAEEVTPDEEDDAAERAKKDDDLADLIRKYGGIDNVPIEKLDAEERRRMKLLGLDSELLNSRKEIAEWTRSMEGTIEDGFGIGIQIGYDQLDGKPTVPLSSIIDSRAAREALQSFNIDMAVRSLKATKVDLMRLIDKGLAEGISVRDISKAISTKYGEQYKGYRATRIARTESTGVLNAGTHMTLQLEGVKTKRWIATLGDDRTRETHLETHADSERSPVPIDESYLVGGYKAEYPGDNALPPEERINCRCTEVNGEVTGRRSKAYTKLWLRQHGSYEKKFNRALRRAFTEQLSRLQDNLQPSS